MTKPALTEVLESVNRIRAEHGKKPLKRMPKGVPGQSQECPLANALRVCGVHEVATDGEVLWADGEWESLPETLEYFPIDFDRGEYPELVK